jgi:hypothetical protein
MLLLVLTMCKDSSSRTSKSSVFQNLPGTPGGPNQNKPNFRENLDSESATGPEMRSFLYENMGESPQNGQKRSQEARGSDSDNVRITSEHATKGQAEILSEEAFGKVNLRRMGEDSSGSQDQANHDQGIQVEDYEFLVNEEDFSPNTEGSEFIRRNLATSCTNVVYPLIYGDGEQALTVKDAKGFSNADDFLIGGLYMKTSTQGQGFLFRIYRSGKFRWQKVFSSGNSEYQDMVEKVDTYNGWSYAIISTNMLGTKVFYVVKINSSGSLSRNHRVANQDTYTFAHIE